MDDLEKIFSRSVVRTKDNRNPVAEIFRYAKRKVDGSLPCFPNQPEYNSRDTSHPKEFIWRAYMRFPKHIKKYVKWCNGCGIAKPRTIKYFARAQYNKDGLSCQCRELANE